MDRLYYSVENIGDHYRHDGDWTKTLRTAGKHAVEVEKIALDVVLTVGSFVPVPVPSTRQPAFHFCVHLATILTWTHATFSARMG